MTKKTKIALSTFLLCFAFLFIGERKSLSANSIFLQYNPTKTTLYTGETTPLKVTGTKSKVLWTTSDKKIATVNQKGIVKARKPGKVSISAFVDNLSFFCDFQVIKKPKAVKKTKLEKEILKKLKKVKKDFPQGMKWGNEKEYYCEAINTLGFGCAGLAFQISDILFGKKAPVYYVTDLTHIEKEIRIGDILRVADDTHSVVVVNRDKEGVTLVEGNFTFNDQKDMIQWGERYTYKDLKETVVYYQTRHPR